MVRAIAGSTVQINGKFIDGATSLQGFVDNINKANVGVTASLNSDNQIVLANGAWSESFQPGDRTLAGLDDPQRDELLRLFPALAGADDPAAVYPAARVTLKSWESRALIGA